MPIRYSIDKARNVIVETWSGKVTAAALENYWRGYLADPDVMNCRRTLVDLRKGKIAFTGAELSQLVKTVALPVIGDRKWSSALLVTSAVPFGTSRQYQVYAEQYSRDAIFTDETEAMDWLLKQDPDAA